MGFSLGSVTANMGELKEVWDKLNISSWGGLIDAVRQTREDKGNTGTLDRIENFATTAENEGNKFPDSFNGLAEMIT